MDHLGIRESDLEESFVRSGGPGGQNVNKVSTCVVLKHLPTGLTVRCQAERSQAQNRHAARCLLVRKLEARAREKRNAEARSAAKIKLQKRKRSRGSKEEVLKSKRERSEIKHRRRRVNFDE